ncbi:MAG: hypothetical protein FRX48_02293 [Lasallia pustulata]|uniref:Uncharacterized protein n=1 Tax=Lasallia pustulata TaxID=136370 RepID=A0A5M8PWZ2_9LECA|nr:MAG: hypothetical protein FRX48_02293 [Lasallia pustulata]
MSSKLPHLNILQTSHQLYNEGREILYHDNTFLVRVFLESEGEFVVAKVESLQEWDFMKHFRKLKIIVMSDEPDDLEITRPFVRKIYEVLLKMKLNSLEISLDCHYNPDKGRVRWCYYNRDKTQTSWESYYANQWRDTRWKPHYPDGMFEALRPFIQL